MTTTQHLFNGFDGRSSPLSFYKIHRYADPNLKALLSTEISRTLFLSSIVSET